MNLEQIQAVFQRCGLGKMGKELSFKLWIKGIGESCDEEILEGFLISYDFRDDCRVLADQFEYHLNTYKTVLKSIDLNNPFLF